MLAAWLVRPRLARPRVGAEGRELLRFGGGTSLSLVLNFWALHGDYVVIGSALGSKPLGYYSRAYQLVSTVPGMLGRLHTMILFPAFSRAQSDLGYLGQALRVGTEATAALTLPLCAWGLVLGPELITVLLGPGWELTVLPFQILSLGVYFRAAYNLSASIIWATGHVFSLSACQGLYGALIVVGAIYGSQWGIPGVAAATLVALFVFYLALYLLAARISGTPFLSFAKVHLRPSMLFLLVLSSAYLGRTACLALGSPALATLVFTVALGIAAVAVATHFLGRRLWGDFVYDQGATLFRGYTSRTNGDTDERDDGRT